MQNGLIYNKLSDCELGFDAKLCPKAKIDEERIEHLCSKMYLVARKNCSSDTERQKIQRVTPEQLEVWGIITREGNRWLASNAYALLMGDPAFSIRLKCGLFKGDDKAVFLDNREYTGSVLELIEQGITYILSKIDLGGYYGGVYHNDRFELPRQEMRELVVNAFLHREYLQHDDPVFIAIFDSRVEITSPGGLPLGQTVERALTGYSKVRNVVLATALNYMGYVEEWGSGLQRVNRCLAECNLQGISLEDAGFAVRVNVFRAKNSHKAVINSICQSGRIPADRYAEAMNIEGVGEGANPNEGVNEGANEGANLNEGVNKGVNEGVNLNEGVNEGANEGANLNEGVNEGANEGANPNEGVNEGANEGIKETYIAIFNSPGIRTPELVTKVRKSRSTVERAIAELKKLGKIEFRGATKNGGYYCRENFE